METPALSCRPALSLAHVRVLANRLTFLSPSFLIPRGEGTETTWRSRDMNVKAYACELHKNKFLDSRGLCQGNGFHRQKGGLRESGLKKGPFLLR